MHTVYYFSVIFIIDSTFGRKEIAVFIFLFIYLLFIFNGRGFMDFMDDFTPIYCIYLFTLWRH